MRDGRLLVDNARCADGVMDMEMDRNGDFNRVRKIPRS
jgi:hypothetical protein